MKIIAAICIGLATGVGALASFAQQRGSLVTTLANDVPLEFVRIAPGEFMMGCSAGNSLCTDDEKPAHRVRITGGFEMGKFEVTSAQFRRRSKRTGGRAIPRHAWRVFPERSQVLAFIDESLHRVHHER